LSQPIIDNIRGPKIGWPLSSGTYGRTVLPSPFSGENLHVGNGYVTYRRDTQQTSMRQRVMRGASDGSAEAGADRVPPSMRWMPTQIASSSLWPTRLKIG